MAYIDIQKAYNTIDSLMLDVDRSKQWRVMVVENKKRHIMPQPSLVM